ncbi:MAG: fibronectin type III domain-containing protein [Lachnospiraceae bacterium]|nr:fibronectin type III domain-containing protein [Lachnospiraceae bacterium]
MCVKRISADDIKLYVLPNGAYTLRAIAIDASGNESTEEFTRRYVIDNTGIGQIEITKHTVSATGVSIHWADVTENDFGYFQVEQLAGDSFVSVGTTSTVLGYQVGGLVPNTTYSFRVVGYDNLGNRGIPSEELTITTAEDTTAPVLTAVYPVASYYRDKLALQVKAQDDYAISKAVFSYSLDKESFEEIADVEAGTISGTATISTDFDISKLPEGKLYVKFQVYDAAGNKNAPLSTGEDVIVEYIIDRTAPGKVEGVKAVGTCGYVELNWNSEEMQDIKAYKIYRADAETGIFSVIQEAWSARNYYDTAVEVGKVYIYKIAAIDIAGNVSEIYQVSYSLDLN